MNAYGFDIETMPNKEMTHILDSFSSRTKMSKEENMSLFPEVARIASIAVWGEKIKDCWVIEDDSDRAEKILLRQALKLIGDITTFHHCKLVGYNSKLFDMPFIFKRAIIQGVDYTLSCNNLQRLCNKYHNKWHVDISDIINQGSTSHISLKAASEIYLKEKKDDYDYKKILTDVENNDTFALKKYNLKDAELTYKLYIKCQGLMED